MTPRDGHERCRYTVVIPTIGRTSLSTLLYALGGGEGPPAEAVVVVDDRPSAPGAPSLRDRVGLPERVGVAPLVLMRSTGRGPATARDIGWRAVHTEWVVFLDDDVVTGPDWPAQLVADLSGLGPDVGGSQGAIDVPRPPSRRPTDWERNVIALEQACWATADLAYRVEVLRTVGGFDRRFPRAHREDSDLGLRVTEAGWTIVRGTRRVTHPVRGTDPWVSVRAQRGNRDDQLMAAIHGPGWRARSAAGPARNGRHLLTAGSAVVGALALAAGRRRAGVVAATVWAAGTSELLVSRILPGPRTAREIVRMAATSLAIPPVACWHLGVGRVQRGRWLRSPGPGPQVVEPARGRRREAHEVREVVAAREVREVVAAHEVRAVLFDRDGTLVEDVPYNGDPDAVRPVPGAAAAVRRLRERGLRVGVITNQSGVARGLLSPQQVSAVNRRVDELIGPIDTWQCCLHGPDDGCRCRKPGPGLVEAAAAALGVTPAECVVVGDIAADLGAARSAGARAILVPTPATRAAEIAGAAETAPDLAAAAEMILRTAAPERPGGHSRVAAFTSGRR